jgi:GntR family transcriptional repressor for pyruvate dehydrogenase complex
MVLTPITKRQVPDDVFDQLMNEVVDGAYAAGDALPSERRLAELLGVSRPAVREALQRMSATRLVEVRHGGSTTVRDFQRYAGLDLLPRMLVRDGELDPAVARSIVEARYAIAPSVARMAAERSRRAQPGLRESLGAAVEALAVVATPVERQHAALAFWDALVDLADSLVFRMMFNNLRLAYEPAIEALAPLLDGEVGHTEAYRAICTAVLDADPVAAQGATEALLRPGTLAMVGFLDDYEDDETGATSTAAPEGEPA